MPPVLVVFSRDGCHLCDEMVAGLAALRPQYAFTVEVVDVDRDSSLQARYGEDVPVLAGAGREICRHRLDRARVETWLRERAAAPGQNPPR